MLSPQTNLLKSSSSWQFQKAMNFQSVSPKQFALSPFFSSCMCFNPAVRNLNSIQNLSAFNFFLFIQAIIYQVSNACEPYQLYPVQFILAAFSTNNQFNYQLSIQIILLKVILKSWKINDFSFFVLTIFVGISSARISISRSNAFQECIFVSDKSQRNALYFKIKSFCRSNSLCFYFTTHLFSEFWQTKLYSQNLRSIRSSSSNFAFFFFADIVRF